MAQIRENMRNVEIHKAICEIQRLDIVKNIRNDYGGFNYLKIATILNKIEPVLKKYKLRVAFNDEMLQIGKRYYVKAVAKLITEEGEYVEAYAYAREDKNKKGMDKSQITGSCSTYARKYALCGMLGVEGEEDMDSKDNTKSESRRKPKKKKPKPDGTQVKCDDCGKVLSDSEIEWCQDFHDGMYCMKCQDNHNKKSK